MMQRYDHVRTMTLTPAENVVFGDKTLACFPTR